VSEYFFSALENAEKLLLMPDEATLHVPTGGRKINLMFFEFLDRLSV